MPTLNWIGKEAVVKHHKDVPFRLLEPVPALSCGVPESGNLIVQGDNLHALKALLPRYAGQVKCIYIDPPYNTGNEGWAYNDNVNSPEIRKWLGEVVGKEGETLDRHDRWLCMMYPRLVLLKQFLREDGIIFISIDDDEVSRLRLLMDEIFGASKFIAQFVWKSRQNKDNRNISNVSIDHEYILCYGTKLRGSRRDESQYSNHDNDPRGPWSSANMVGLADEKSRPNLHYDLVDPETGINYGKPAKGWRYDRHTMARLISEGKVIFPPSPKGRPRKKQFFTELLTEFTGYPSIVGKECYTNDGTKELIDIFGEASFEFPKNTRLLKELIEQATDKDSIILDSFAGSGTTGHAVLRQNAEDGGNRRFILIEMDAKIAQNVTCERVKRVAEGYSNAKGQSVEGLGGGCHFFRLSAEPLFAANGQIRSDVTFAQLAEFVWFAETGTGFTAAAESPLLGIHNGCAIYLLYNGILSDKSVDNGNVLTSSVFDVLPNFVGPKVVYAAANRMGTRAAREGITFKQTPYALEV
jgi:adenine-specific DNA-methyltransferase